ncbi:hypothetical protein [Nitrosovibrio sp. Nv4]|uniref:hypothetical protein n=1 Tax=Nitrosovibrio sp. Nv4 TaxID=1945880 RepID=UPI000BC45F5A|nr:hypothetical protein [Nitrosovibrio sp. Nv4]SOD40928.1 hypothetical protein SAMN06298226_1213 [Nitrosovibrio sp. Nv4]
MRITISTNEFNQDTQQTPGKQPDMARVFIADRGREVCTATADNKYQKLTGTPASIIRYYLCLEWKMSSSIDKATTAKRETWRHSDIGGCVTTVACCCQPLNSNGTGTRLIG